MKTGILVVIFLIIWFGIGGYLVYLDIQIRKLRRKVQFQDREESQN